MKIMNEATCTTNAHVWRETVEVAAYEKTLDVWVDKQRRQTCTRCGQSRVWVDNAPALHQAIAVAIAESPRPIAAIELRYCRQVLGLKPAGLAVALGVARATVSRWEAETTPIPSSAQIAFKLLVLLRFGRDYRQVQIDGPRERIFMRSIRGHWLADDPPEFDQRAIA